MLLVDPDLNNDLILEMEDISQMEASEEESNQLTW